MLAHEMESKTDTKVLLIVNPRILAVLLDKIAPDKFKALTAATHPKGTSEKAVGINYKLLGYPEMPPANKEDSPTPVDAPSVPPTKQWKLDDFDVNTLLAAIDPLPKLHSLLDGLTGIISERNEAVTELLTTPFLAELTLAELVYLGRRLYGSASSLSAGGFDVLDAFRSGSLESDGIVNALAFGMLIELYFAEHLSLRKTPKNGPFTGLFELQTQDRYQPCIRKLTDLLMSSTQLLLAIPATAPTIVDLHISFNIPVGSKDKLLNSLLCGGRQILCDVAADNLSALSSLLGKNTATVEEIRSLVSRRFFVPVNQIKPDRELATVLTWAPHSGICHCRTDFGGVVDDFMCSKIRRGKEHRQFIFTTHSSSLAVASDTDKFLIMEATATHGKILFSGSMDHTPISDEVLKYLEGGVDTYRAKYGKYRVDI